MRFAAVVILTICQFTAFPFLERLAINTINHHVPDTASSSAEYGRAENVTTVYKTIAL